MQDLVQNIIDRVRIGNLEKQVIQDFVLIIKELKEAKDCDIILIGCTDLSMIYEEAIQMNPDLCRDVQFVDCIDATVEAVVKIGKGDLDYY